MECNNLYCITSLQNNTKAFFIRSFIAQSVMMAQVLHTFLKAQNSPQHVHVHFVFSLWQQEKWKRSYLYQDSLFRLFCVCFNFFCNLYEWNVSMSCLSSVFGDNWWKLFSFTKRPSHESPAQLWQCDDSGRGVQMEIRLPSVREHRKQLWLLITLTVSTAQLRLSYATGK